MKSTVSRLATALFSKTCTIIFFFVWQAGLAQELPFAWNKSIQPLNVINTTASGNAYFVQDMVIGASGTRYITGRFNGTIDFDPTSGTNSLTSKNNSDDIFIAAYNSLGALIFVKSIGSNAVSESGNGIYQQPGTGNLIITGQFQGTADFDPGVGTANLTSAGGIDSFILLLDQDGNYISAVNIGGANSDQGFAVVANATGIFVSGTFTGTVDMDPGVGTVNLTSSPSNAANFFFTRFDNTLKFVWAYNIDIASGNLFISTNNLFITSNDASATADYDPGAGVAHATAKGGSSDAIVAKYDFNGSFIWVESFGGNFYESAPVITVDASDQIYLTGSFQGITDLNPKGVAPFTSNGSNDSYLAMWDSFGNFMWAKTWGGTNNDQTQSIGLLNGNQIAVSGIFSGTTDLDPGPSVLSFTSSGAQDGFLSLFDNTGNLLNGFGFGGKGSDSGGIISTTGNRIELAGSYSGTTDFDPTSNVNGLATPNPNFAEAYISTYTLLATVPAAQPTAFVPGVITSSSIDFSFTAPATPPAGYIVLQKSGSSPTGVPKDGKKYFVGSIIDDAVVVASGNSVSGTASLLAANTNYFFKVYSFNGSNESINYSIVAPLQASAFTSPVASNRTSDSLTLVTLYNSLGGPGWTNKTNWLLPGSTIDTWYGVSLVGNRVDALNLSLNNLSGQIPGAIGNLTAIQTLDLHGNIIFGQIPVEIGTLSNLKNLALYQNQLTGIIPSEMGNIIGLLYFDASSNSLTGSLPASFSGLTALNFLGLGSNKLAGTLDPIKNLTALSQIWLQNNQFSGAIPTEIGAMSGLVNLSLSNNRLTGSLPGTLGNLSLLQQLFLGINQLTGSIPSTIGNLTALTQLDLGSNKFTGALPSQIGNLTSLANFYIGYNSLVGTVPVTPSFTNLNTLDLRNNQFDVLADLSSITSLTTLLVANNNFTFEDLEPNISKLGPSTNYSPQNIFGTITGQSLSVGQTLNLSFPAGGASTAYQWEKDGTAVGGNSNSFSVPALTTVDAGVYTLTLTNSVVTGLTITSTNQTVNVKAEGIFSWADAGQLTSEGLDPTGTGITDENYAGQWGDYNNDGFEDLFVAGISAQERSYLYKNNGDGTFSKAPNGAYFFTSGRSVAWADYNNDGFLDAFAPGGIFAPDSVSTSSIFKNNGNGTFTKIGLPGDPGSSAGVWADTDNDGDVDLIVNGGIGYVSLYRNDGGNNFTLVPAFTSNLNSQWNNLAIDVNGDNKMDVYIPDDTQRSFYLGNGNNTFTRNTSTPLVTDALAGTRGISWADIDNDGDFDAYVMTNSVGNVFYLNDGLGNFTQQTSLTVLGETVFGGRGSAFADYDNDGYVDLLTFQGNSTPAGWYLFRNNGNGTFSKQTNQNFKIGNGFVGASFADYDNDGFQDISSASFGIDYNGLYHNSGNGNHWLQVKLKGTVSNRSAIGAKVSVKAGGFWRHQQILTANGFANQNSLIAQFGLGSSTVADSIRIQWPSGYKQVSTNVAANQRLQMDEINFLKLDSLALVAFYNATGGPTWANKTNWLTGSLKTWYGVTVRNNRVAKIQIYSNNITGPLPLSLVDLTGLDTLAIAGNKLSGTLPPEIGSLTNLKYIDLGGNLFTGSLPASVFNLTQLNTFGFAGNQLSGTIPPAVGKLVNVVNFWIDRNKFSGALPAEINNLTKVKNFYIQNNEFTFAPPLTGFTLYGGSIQNNFLEFDALIPNASIGGLAFDPQNKLQTSPAQSLLKGQPATFSRPVAGSGNAYQWKNGSATIAGANADTYSIASVAPTDNGSYNLTITNPAIPGFSLQTENFILTITSAQIADESGYQFYKELGARAQGLNQITAARDVLFDGVGNLYALDSYNLEIKKFDNSGAVLSTIGGPGSNDGRFTIAFSMALDASENIYVIDFSLARVQKFDPTGKFLLKWGSFGPAAGQFRSPRGIAVDTSTGNVFVADTGNNRVQVFNSYGNFLFSFGGFGTGNGQFNSPYKVTIGGGFVYVADRLNNRIQIFDTSGVYVSQFGSLGSGDGQLNGPSEIAVDTNGDILVCDQGNARIQRFNSSGSFVSTFGVLGILPGQLKAPEGIALASNGDVVVGDLSNGVQRFTSAGVFVSGLGTFGSALGLFRSPVGIAQDSKGYRYVIEQGNARVQKLDRNGNPILSFGAFGSGPGQFTSPQAIAIDRTNNIYVCDGTLNNVQKFDPTGNLLLSFGSSGSGDGQFSFPVSMAFDKANTLWILESGNKRVQQFKTDGTFISKFGVSGTAPGQFSSPLSISLDYNGDIFVSENTSTNRIQKFKSDGTFLYAIGGPSGLAPGQLNGARGLSSDFLGNVYLADYFNQRVQKLENDFSYLTKFGETGTGNGDLFNGPNFVASNVTGDTLWISELPNRIQIWTAKPKPALASDSLALVSIYNSLGGANWNNKTNWLVGKMDTWYGVTAGAGRVRGLNLESNNLVGTIPPTIGDLTQLVSLNMQGNKIIGVPAEIINLIKLKQLNLSSNALSGDFPPQLGAVPELNILKISNNKLKGQVTLPPFLHVAHLNNNQLDGLPDVSASMDTLKVQANKFDFADLESNISVLSFVYSPQDSVEVKQSVLKQLNDTQTFNATIGGTANVYQWKRNNADVTGETNSSITISNIPLSEDGNVYSYAATNTIVTGLTLVSRPMTLKVSSLRRDSIALRALYVATDGPNWTNHSNWITTPLGTGNWFGVTISNNRVTGLNLPSNNVAGVVPKDLSDISNLTSVNLSSNKITKLPDLKPLNNLTTLNVSSNKLDFASLLPNTPVSGINYLNQADIGVPFTELLDVGSDYKVKVLVNGTGNLFQWKRNGTEVSGAIDSTYMIKNINRSNMGAYVAEVTNPAVPGLTLKTATQRVLATATLSGRLLLDETTPISKGSVLLLKVTAVGGYDTTTVKNVNTDGSFVLEKTVLDDYVLQGKPDPTLSPDRLLIYYKDKLFWEEADTLKVQNSLTGLDLLLQKRPVPLTGAGSIAGILEENIGSPGRGLARKRVEGAEVSARRVETTSRTEGEKLTLVAVTTTDKDGNFTLDKLPPANYRLNIQYPGYPMDPTSFINFSIGTKPSTTNVNVDAVVQGNKIVVGLVKITGIGEEIKLFAYPNPAVDRIHLEFDKSELAVENIVLTDLTGRDVPIKVTKTAKGAEIELQSVGRGFYIITLLDKDGNRLYGTKVSIE